MTENRKKLYQALRKSKRLLPIGTKTYTWDYIAWGIRRDEVIAVYANRHETTYVTAHGCFDASNLGYTTLLQEAEVREVYANESEKVDIVGSQRH